MSFLTCFWLLPQKEHFSRSPPSPNLATSPPPAHDRTRRCRRAGSAHARRHADGSELSVRDHLVDDPVFLRLCRAHDEVAVGVAGDLLDLLPRVVGEDLVERLAHAHDLLGLDLDVDGLPGGATVGLVDEHPRVGEDVTLPGGPRRQDHRGRRGGLAQADGGDVGLDELHRVVDGEQTGDLATGRVDVDRDVLVGLLALEVQQLRNHDVGDDVVDRGAEEDDAVLQQPREDVVAVGAARGVLRDVGDVDVLEVAHCAGSSSGTSGTSVSGASWSAGGSAAGPSLSASSGCGRERSTGSPSASTTSAWSIRNASALPRAISERTASMTPRRSRSLRTFAGFSFSCSARRSTSASTSSSVAAICSCAITARSARSARTASVAPTRTLSTNSCWSWPVAPRYCGIVILTPCSSSRWARSWRRRSISVFTSVSGTSSGASAAAASKIFSRISMDACTRA